MAAQACRMAASQKYAKRQGICLFIIENKFRNLEFLDTVLLL